jgi:tetratricopeptide (TPR) repeat protein
MIDSKSNTLLARVWLLGEFAVERKKDDGTWERVNKAAWDGNYARVLLKRLLCAPGRRVARSDILDDLWPHAPSHLAEKYLNNASSKLRQILHKDVLRPFGPHGISGYQLAEQALVWTDVDACDSLIRDVERLGFSSPDALLLLESAEELFARGSILEGESGQWCLPLRTTHEMALHYCRVLLAQCYETQNMFWQARGQYQSLLDLNPLDEDALCRLLALLHHQGMYKDVRLVYEQTRTCFQEYGLSLSPTTQRLAEKLLNEPIPSAFVMKLLTTGKIAEYESSSFGVTEKPSIMYTMGKPSLSLPDLEMLMRSRRQVLREILSTACTALAFSPYALFPPDTRERLEFITMRPSSVDTEALAHLAAITNHYWDLSRNATVDLLIGIAGHFTTITQLLKDSPPTPVYERLCELASENAMVLGRVLSEIREYDLALEYYQFALKVARDARNTDLWASGIGRIALLFVHWGQPQQALPLLHEAQRQELYNPRLRPWLSAIEAEVYSMTGDMDACIRCLDRSKSVTLSISMTDDIYKTRFHLSRVAGYEGACFMRLRQPERALSALQQAFSPYEDPPLLQRSVLLADRGAVYAQLGDVQTACSFILQAVDIIKQTKSLIGLQRIYKGREELDPWKDSNEVKNLDERIFTTLNTFTKLKEQV